MSSDQGAIGKDFLALVHTLVKTVQAARQSRIAAVRNSAGGSRKEAGRVAAARALPPPAIGLWGADGALQALWGVFFGWLNLLTAELAQAPLPHPARTSSPARPAYPLSRLFMDAASADPTSEATDNSAPAPSAPSAPAPAPIPSTSPDGSLMHENPLSVGGPPSPNSPGPVPAQLASAAMGPQEQSASLSGECGASTDSRGGADGAQSTGLDVVHIYLDRISILIHAYFLVSGIER